VILRNYLAREQLAPLIKGTVVDGYEFLADDKNALRERLLEDVARMESPQNDETGTLPVDHFFNVRGIGTVVLDLWPKEASRSMMCSWSCRERRLPWYGSIQSMMRTSIRQAWARGLGLPSRDRGG